MSSAYASSLVLNHIRKIDPKIIVECGACDGSDTLELMEVYKPNIIHTFECNPENIPLCHKKLDGHPNIVFVPKAVSDVTGSIQFYPGDMMGCRIANSGISSAYPFNDGYPQFKLKEPVIIPSTRLDDYMSESSLKTIDLLCMDTQGSELDGLKGLGNRIDDVKAVVCEVWFTPYYKGIPVLDDIDGYMRQHGFKRTELYKYDDFGDALYLRK